jgi:hypothetical protein
MEREEKADDIMVDSFQPLLSVSANDEEVTANSGIIRAHF